MKKYVREMLDELRKRNKKDFLPQVPKSPTDGKTIDLMPPPQPAQPRDLENQELSKNPKERVRQLDFQAQQNEERERLG